MEEGYIGRERRQQVRWYEALEGEFIFFSDLVLPDLPQQRRGTIRNFSSNGFCAEAKVIEGAWKDALFSSMIKVGVAFKLPKAGEIKALGRIIWLRRQEEEKGDHVMGVEFLEITAANQDMLKKYIIDAYLEIKKAKGK